MLRSACSLPLSRERDFESAEPNASFSLLTFDPVIAVLPGPVPVALLLTFESVMVRGLSREQHVGEQAVEGIARVAGTVFHIVANSWL